MAFANTHRMLRLTTDFQTVIDVPPSQELMLASLCCVNTTGGAVSLYLCLVPEGGTAKEANALFWAKSISANDAIEFGHDQLVPGYLELQAKASINDALNLVLSGELVPPQTTWSALHYVVS